MQPHPERPEDHQTQSANGTYRERRRPTHTLKNKAKGYAPNQRGYAGQRVVDAKPAPVTPAGRR